MALKIVTWNVLADCYSYGLEKDQECKRIHHLSWDRWHLIQHILTTCDADVICLQEVDHYDDYYSPFFHKLNYISIYLPRPHREDGCLIAFKPSKLQLQEKIDIQFDDLIHHFQLSSSIQHKYMKHNCALLLHLSLIHQPTVQFLISNCHLFWNPSYPEVKLAQTCYLLQIIQRYQSINRGIIITGDFNSLPGSEVYTVMTQGSKAVDLYINKENIKFLCDSSLHRFCRWLRILGIDTALESSQEHAARARGCMHSLFDRCRREGRVLLTTSKSLTERRFCPDSYIICVRDFQESLVDLCIQFSISLNPEEFLTKCVKCNGKIESCAHSDTRLLQSSQNIPDNVPVFVCNGCYQAYWWSELENSPAVRAKKAADALYSLVCTRVQQKRMDEDAQKQMSREREKESGHADSVDMSPTGQRPPIAVSREDSNSSSTRLEQSTDSDSSHPERSVAIKEGETESLLLAEEVEEVEEAASSLSRTSLQTESRTTSLTGDEGEEAFSCSSSTDKNSSWCLCSNMKGSMMRENERLAEASEDMSHPVTAASRPVIRMQVGREEEIRCVRNCHFPSYRSALALMHGQEPVATNWNGGFIGTLDYIFVSTDIKVVDAELMPTGFGDVSWCCDTPPNALWPSDHALLSCNVNFST